MSDDTVPGGVAGGELIAAIDCGTNTIKLLIADVVRDGGRVQLREVERKARTVRLGQGLDQSGRIADEAIARAFAAVEEYAALIARHGIPADRVRFVATSASRDAANGAEFAAGVAVRLGVEPEIVAGDVEAGLSYRGAIKGLQIPVTEPLLVVDIGGGSTEIIKGTREGYQSAFSMDIGSVRMTERHLHGDPPSREQLDACIADIDAHLDQSWPIVLGGKQGGVGTLIGVSGTFTQMASFALGLDVYSHEAVDQRRIPAATVRELVSQLLRMTVAERLAMPTMNPGRADVMIGGALILDRILCRSGVDDLVVSDADILHGIAWSLADPEGED